jgi:hypothetical protein
VAQILVHYQLSGESDALNRLIESVDPIANVHAALETDLARLAAGYDSSELLESESHLCKSHLCKRPRIFAARVYVLKKAPKVYDIPAVESLRELDARLEVAIHEV